MQKLFIDFEPNGQITLNEEQSRHIAKALRMKKETTTGAKLTA